MARTYINATPFLVFVVSISAFVLGPKGGAGHELRRGRDPAGPSKGTAEQGWRGQRCRLRRGRGVSRLALHGFYSPWVGVFLFSNCVCTYVCMFFFSCGYLEKYFGKNMPSYTGTRWTRRGLTLRRLCVLHGGVAWTSSVAFSKDNSKSCEAGWHYR